MRFNAGETSKDEVERHAFARCLALLTGGEDDGGAYVDDAFGAVHRKHASVYDVAKLLPHYCGDLVRDELDGAAPADRTTRSGRTWSSSAASKVSDKLAVIESLLPKVDKLLVGGGMCFTFLKAQGHEVGESLLEDDQIETCRTLLAEAADKIVLPTDIVVAADRSPRTRRPQVVAADAIPAGAQGPGHRPGVGRGVRRGPGRRRRRCSGTARWACSRWRRSRPARKGVAEAVAACSGLTRRRRR